jgi:ATP-binding cassette subfamily C protein
MRAKAFWRLLVDIRSVVGRRYWLYLWLVALTGLMEGVSIASVVPLLAAMGIGSTGVDASGNVSRLASALVGGLGLQLTVFSLGMVVVLTLIVSSLLFLSQAYLGTSLQTTYVYSWQRRLVSGMFGARWGYFLQHRQGHLVNALVTEAQRLGGAFYQAGLLVTGVVHGVILTIIAGMLSVTTTLLVMGGGAVLFLLTRPLIQRAYRIGTGISVENAALQSAGGELISGAKLVKATATEFEARRVLCGIADRLRQHFRANAFDVQVVKTVFDFGAATIVAGILIVNHAWLTSDPSVTLVILAIFVRLMPKLTGVQQSLQGLTTSLSAVELLQQTAAQAESEAETSSAAPLPRGLSEGPLAISLQDVDVHYGTVAAVAGVSLEIPAGSCVALVGGSGAGKSTLVDAILGLVPVSKGDVRVNDVPLDRLPLPAFRRRVGYMGQETVLYNASVRENVLWGRPARAQDELHAAIRVAGAGAFISRLPRGYDALVGDRGALLSGGERQRLGLARAALGLPGLLILDEATSALDAETEREVTDAVAAFKGRTTVIMIAHRLSSVLIADTICVMEEGRIVEQGSWDELMRRGGRLYQLWNLQHEKG